MNSKRIVGNNFEVALIWADRLTFGYHSHDEYVLSCNISGNEKLRLDGGRMEAREGCTTLYNPGQIQEGDGTNCLVSVYLEPDFFEKELLANRAISYNIPIVNDSELLTQFRTLAGLILSEASAAVAEEAVFHALELTIDRYTTLKTERNPGVDDWRLKRAQDLLISNLERQVTLDELTQVVGLNKLALIQMFSRALGLPPISWQRAQRIAAARRLLRSGTPAAEVAYRTGFSDQAHLTRWFNRAYGITPVRFAHR